MQTFRENFLEFAKDLEASKAARAEFTADFARGADQRRAANAAEAHQRSERLGRTLTESRNARREWFEGFATRTRQRTVAMQAASQERKIQLSEMAAGVAHLRGRIEMESRERQAAMRQIFARDRERLDEFNKLRAGWRQEFRDARGAWLSASGTTHTDARAGSGNPMSGAGTGEDSAADRRGAFDPSRRGKSGGKRGPR